MRAACAIAALTALSVTSHATAEHVTVDLGWFMNTGGGGIYYDGGFTPWVSSGFGPGSTTHTVIGIDVAGILAALSYEWLTGVTITDTGANAYGTFSPGADVDLLRLTGIDSDAAVSWTYDGPNINHDGETSWHMAYRTAGLDSLSGHQEWDWTHVSLGNHGSLAATFEPQRLRDNAPFLALSEAGSFESFRVSLDAIVPAPGALSVLAFAVLSARRRRRASRP